MITRAISATAITGTAIAPSEDVASATGFQAMSDRASSAKADTADLLAYGMTPIVVPARIHAPQARASPDG